MQDLLTPVTTRTLAKPRLQTDASQVSSTSAEGEDVQLRSADDVIRILRSQPSAERVSVVLHWLDTGLKKDGDYDIQVPSTRASQIIFAIITEVIPHYWGALRDSDDLGQVKLRKVLLRCLRSVAGIAAIVNRLRILLKERSKQRKSENAGNVQLIGDLIEVLERILKKENLISYTWSSLKLRVASGPKRTLLWKEFSSLIAGGRILSLAAEVDHTINTATVSIIEATWLSKGIEFAAWLGRNVFYTLNSMQEDDQDEGKAVAHFFSKALTLGYTDHVVAKTFASLFAGNDNRIGSYRNLIRNLTGAEQKNLLFSLTRILSGMASPFDVEGLGSDEQGRLKKFLAGAAALLSGLTEGNAKLRGVLIQWLTSTASSGIVCGNSIHRAVIASLAHDHHAMKEVFQKTLVQFGDKLYVKHTPVLQQKVNVQVLLLVVGYLFRSDPDYVVSECRSSIYINSISIHLAASSQRACFLGMVVGTAVSELIDGKEKKLNFSDEELDGADGRWYRSLTAVQDSVGSISDLRSSKTKPADTKIDSSAKFTNGKSEQPSKKQSTMKVISIEEIDEESESEDDDLVAFQKPDSDASDEDEDATLVQRNKPTAPVYIRDLIAGLRDTEDFDRHRLALSNASSLIRRKANFGSEVSEHIEELATLLTGLSDKYNIDDFQKLRLQGMVAVVTAQPLQMGQWFSKTFFRGEYSMGQRASILTILGLGARELAGLREEDSMVTGAAEVAKNPFPSKVLPDKLHKIYALEAKPVDTLSERMEKTMLKPMAIEAADHLSGPNALKVRTFSSRLEVEKKRAKPIPNELAKVVADGFFFPLTGLWRMQLQAYGDQNVHTSPFLLNQYLRTLSIILHASGTSTLSLSQMTSEFWDLLLSLRPRASDLPVLEALLFSFLTLLDINSNNQRRLAEEHAKELLETQEWVQMVFEKVGGGSEEGDRVRMLAAGVLTKTREVVEKYQRLMLGDLAEFM